MSFPAYPEYKDSGVPWLGAVPEHWERKPLFALAKELDELNHGMQEDNLLSLSYGRIKRKNIEDNDGLLPASFETYQIVERDDIVWRLTDLQNDQRSLRTGIVRERGIITSAYLATRPTAVLPEFLSYLLRAYDLTKVFYSMGGGLRQSMKFSDVKWLPIMLPSEAEQSAISAFLDRETAKIDTLVAEQERLIALLKEKRQAVISHAVTKGLNPHAPMKDSGIEWLGEIPAHWEVGKLFYGARLQSGYAFSSSDFGSEGVPVVRMNNLNRGKLDLSEAVRLSDTVCNPAVALCPGDLVWGMSGSIGDTGSLGNFAVVVERDIPCQLNQRVGRFLINKNRMAPEFLQIWIQSQPFYLQIMLAVTGTAQFNVSAEQVQSTMAAFPPLNEQQLINEYITGECLRFVSIIDEAQAAITLLQERRAALVSAAVTGKIDVRGLVDAPATAELETA